MNETYATGKQVNRSPAVIIRRIRGSKEEVPLLVSTQKDGDVVLLRLEPVKGAENRFL
ncbi:MAG: hypothetical protein M0Q91_09185 [Methanoregula sp.]|nr:hypothetical protein [Methanoregula sp.]